MARTKNGKQAAKSLEATLWETADKLRGNLEAAEYKHVVLGLVFLKYVSDAFTARRTELEAALADPQSDDFIPNPDRRKRILESRDEYTSHNVFWIPERARFEYLQENAKQPGIGQFLDEAMDLIEYENPPLKGVLPKNYGRADLDKRLLGELVDLIGSIGFTDVDHGSDDVLGKVYEYFLGKFAGQEGRGAGEFYTPRSVVKLLVELIEPFKGRVYDPCCGSGGMFVQSEEFVLAHGGKRDDIAIYGQEFVATTWRLAKMNLAIRGIEANLGDRPDDSFHRDLHPDLRADFILANPPFNKDDWYSGALTDDPRWKYGLPSPTNANFAWVQHFVHHLAPNGVAAFVMPNIGLSSRGKDDIKIRQRLIEEGLVECIVALPSKMFLNTGSAVCVWILRNKRKHAKGYNHSRQVLFIDAQGLGRMESQTLRIFTSEDVESIANTYHQWCSNVETDGYADREGFCKSATVEEIASRGWSLSVDLYVLPSTDDARALALNSDVDSLAARLRAHLLESDKLARELEEELGSFLDRSTEVDDLVQTDAKEIALSDVAELISRGVAPKYTDSADELMVLNQKCIRDGRVSIAPARRTLSDKVPEAKHLRRNDVLVNSTGVGTLGRVARWTKEQQATVDSHVTIVRFDSSQIDPLLAGFLLMSLQPVIERMGEGSTGQTELSRTKLGALKLRLPSDRLQKQLLPLLRSLEQLGESSARGLSLSGSLRDHVLHLLTSYAERIPE